MLVQILLGSLIVVISIIIQAVFIEFAIKGWGAAVFAKYQNKLSFLQFIVVLTEGTIWMLASLGIIVSIWAILLKAIGAFDDMETCLYFASVSFTTLGFGDILAPKEWRLLGGFIASDGFIIFGLNTAFFLEAMTELREMRK